MWPDLKVEQVRNVFTSLIDRNLVTKMYWHIWKPFVLLNVQIQSLIGTVSILFLIFLIFYFHLSGAKVHTFMTELAVGGH